MFKIFKGDDHDDEDESHGHSSIEVKMEDDDIVEEELGQVALDILDCSDRIIIMAPIAWMDTENVDISVSRNILTISGERRRPDIYDSADRILVEECFFGPFSRSVILPENLAFNKIHADMENNLLRIEIPKLLFGEKTIKINKLEG
ncbi:MAG: Small heat shock protein [uncultured bacterium (gcode 4)]|uniref:Small heat shock protein n=1 Tax=uncultured bacterium (gcode 4) TaxID=1234023 RepID=K1XWJ7_9BACT|nr:MAG: Small heat shock protein [uncultured bacterium (gcode 4)]